MATLVATNLADILKIQNRRDKVETKERDREDAIYDKRQEIYDNPVLGSISPKNEADPRGSRDTRPIKEKMIAGERLTHKQKLILLRDGIMDSFLGRSNDPNDCKDKLINYIEMLKVKHPSVAIKLLDKVVPKDDGITRHITVQAPMIIIDASNPDNIVAAMKLREQPLAIEDNLSPGLDLNEEYNYDQDMNQIDAEFSPVMASTGVEDNEKEDYLDL